MAFPGSWLGASALFLLREDGERGAVPGVAAVRHSDVSEAPRAPGGSPDAERAVAWYYASLLEGNLTASGEPYERRRYTAAHKSLPLGTELRGPTATRPMAVVVNDRGPFVERRDIHLSLAAEEVGLTSPGIAAARVHT